MDKLRPGDLGLPQLRDVLKAREEALFDARATCISGGRANGGGPKMPTAQKQTAKLFAGG